MGERLIDNLYRGSGVLGRLGPPPLRGVDEARGVVEPARLLLLDVRGAFLEERQGLVDVGQSKREDLCRLEVPEDCEKSRESQKMFVLTALKIASEAKFIPRTRFHSSSLRDSKI